MPNLRKNKKLRSFHRMIAWALALLTFVSAWAYDLPVVEAAPVQQSQYYFTLQPSGVDKKWDLTNRVMFDVNFKPIKAYVFRKKDDVKVKSQTSFVYTYDSSTDTYSCNNRITLPYSADSYDAYLQVYYGYNDDEYIVSNTFKVGQTVTEGNCKFTTKPYCDENGNIRFGLAQNPYSLSLVDANTGTVYAEGTTWTKPTMADGKECQVVAQFYIPSTPDDYIATLTSAPFEVNFNGPGYNASKITQFEVTRDKQEPDKNRITFHTNFNVQSSKLTDGTTGQSLSMALNCIDEANHIYDFVCDGDFSSATLLLRDMDGMYARHSFVTAVKTYREQPYVRYDKVGNTSVRKHSLVWQTNFIPRQISVFRKGESEPYYSTQESISSIDVDEWPEGYYYMMADDEMSEEFVICSKGFMGTPVVDWSERRIYYALGIKAAYMKLRNVNDPSGSGISLGGDFAGDGKTYVEFYNINYGEDYVLEAYNSVGEVLYTSDPFFIPKPMFTKQPEIRGTGVVYELNFKPDSVTLKTANGKLIAQGTNQYCYLTGENDDAYGKSCIICAEIGQTRINSDVFFVGRPCNVTYDANGRGNDRVDVVLTGQCAVDRPITANEGPWMFDGWYKDKSCTVPHDFSTLITGDLRLYAKWIEVKATIDDRTIMGRKGTDIGVYGVNLYLENAKFTKPDLEENHAGRTFNSWLYVQNMPKGLELGKVYFYDDLSMVTITFQGVPQEVKDEPIRLSISSVGTNVGCGLTFEINENARFVINNTTINSVALTGLPDKIYVGGKQPKSILDSTDSAEYKVVRLLWKELNGKYLSANDTFVAGQKYQAVYELQPKYGYQFSPKLTATLSTAGGDPENAVLDLVGSTAYVFSKAITPVNETPSYTVSFRDESGHEMELATSITVTENGAEIVLPTELTEVPTWRTGDAFVGWLIDGVTYEPGDSYKVWSDVIAIAKFETVSRKIYIHGLDSAWDTQTTLGYCELNDGYYIWSVPEDKVLYGWYCDLDQSIHPTEGITDSNQLKVHFGSSLEMHLYPVWRSKWEASGSASFYLNAVPEEGMNASFDLLGNNTLESMTTAEELALAYVASGHYDLANPCFYNDVTISAANDILAENGFYHEGVKFTGEFVAGEEYTLVLYLTGKGAFSSNYVPEVIGMDGPYATGATIYPGSNDQIIRATFTFTARTSLANSELISRVALSSEQPIVDEKIFVPTVSVPSDGGYEATVTEGWYEEDPTNPTLWFLGYYYGRETFDPGAEFYFAINVKAKNGYKFPMIESTADLEKLLTVKLGANEIPARNENLTQRWFYSLSEYAERNEREFSIYVTYFPDYEPTEKDVTVELSGLQFPEAGITAMESVAGLTISANSDYALDLKNTNWVHAETDSDMVTNELFELGKAYYLRIRLTQKDANRVIWPSEQSVSAIEVMGENSALATNVLCKGAYARRNEDSTIDLFVGLNEENLMELNANEPVEVQRTDGSIVTYKLRPMKILIREFEDADGVKRQNPISLNFKAGPLTLTNTLVSIDNGTTWTSLATINGIGLNGLTPGQEYLVSFRHGSEDGPTIYEELVRTPDVPEAYLEEGKYPIPMEAFNDTIYQFDGIEINHTIVNDGKPSIVFKAEDERLEGLMNARFVVVQIEENGSGTKITHNTLVKMNTEGEGIYEIPDGLESSDTYVFLMADGVNSFGVRRPYVSAIHEVEAEQTNPAVIRSIATSLDGTIGLQYFVSFPEGTVDGETYAVMTLNGRTVTQKASEAGRQMIGSYNCYYFTMPVYAKEMFDDVTLKLYDKDKNQIRLESTKGADFTASGCQYSVAKYLEFVQTLSTTSEKMKKLATNMLEYGIAAKIHLKYNSENYAVSETTKKVTSSLMDDYVAEQSGTQPADIKSLSFSLDLKSVTTLTMDFTFASEEVAKNYKFKVDGASQTPIWNGATCTLQVYNIGAKDLDEPHDYTVTDSEGKDLWTVTVSALTYARKAIINGTKEHKDELTVIGQGIYLYSKAANEYFTK